MDSLDDYDFTPSSSSSLRSLFDNSIENSERPSLIYTAPKQPKAKAVSDTKNEATKVETSVICARVVQVWKLDAGTYVPVGKVGVAIIGSSTAGELILYKEKRDVIVRAKISPSLELTLKKDICVSFYDSSKNNWSIKFQNIEDCTAVINVIQKFGGIIIATESSTASPEKLTQKSESNNTQSVEKENPTIHEDASTENKTRADILSRMAKMGKSMLPNTNKENDSAQIQLTTSESPPIISSISNEVVKAETPFHSTPNTIIMTQPIQYDPLSIYLAESRAQNMDVRMNLSQISEKLNCLMKEVNGGKSGNETDSDILKSKIKVLELRTENLLRDIKNVQEENIKLKLQLEQNNVLKNEEQYNLQLKVLEEEIKVKTEKIQQQKCEYEIKIEDNSKMIQQQSAEISGLKQQILTLQEETHWKDEVPKLESTISELQKKLHDYEEKQSNNNSELSKEKSGQFTSMLKEEMNVMFSSIVENISEDENKGIIAKCIKSTTVNIIQNFQQLCENTS